MIAFTVQQGLRPRTPQALRTNCGITCFWWHRKNRPTLELGISFFMVIGKRHKPSSQLQLLSVRVQILTNTIEGSIRYILCWTKHEAPFQPTVSLLFLVVISNFKLVTYLDIYLQILQVVSPVHLHFRFKVLFFCASQCWDLHFTVMVTAFQVGTDGAWIHLHLSIPVKTEYWPLRNICDITLICIACNIRPIRILMSYRLIKNLYTKWTPVKWTHMTCPAITTSLRQHHRWICLNLIDTSESQNQVTLAVTTHGYKLAVQCFNLNISFNIQVTYWICSANNCGSSTLQLAVENRNKGKAHAGPT